MNRLLMSIVLDALAFLELSGDDVVAPDAAVGLMESIAHSLQALSLPERQQFLDFVQAQAEEAAARQDNARRSVLLRLAENLGISR